jgi:hypothetical protein
MAVCRVGVVGACDLLQPMYSGMHERDIRRILRVTECVGDISIARETVA